MTNKTKFGIVRQATRKDGTKFFTLEVDPSITILVDGQPVKFKKNERGYEDRVLNLFQVNIEEMESNPKVSEKQLEYYKKINAKFNVVLPKSDN